MSGLYSIYSYTHFYQRQQNITRIIWYFGVWNHSNFHAYCIISTGRTYKLTQRACFDTPHK